MSRPWDAILWNSAGASLWLSYAILKHHWAVGIMGLFQLTLVMCLLCIRIRP